MCFAAGSVPSESHHLERACCMLDPPMAKPSNIWCVCSATCSRQLSMKAPSPGLVALPRLSPPPRSASRAAA
eukprot:6065372-Prymnesium_polylepis.2